MPQRRDPNRSPPPKRLRSRDVPHGLVYKSQRAAQTWGGERQISIRLKGEEIAYLESLPEKERESVLHKLLAVHKHREIPLRFQVLNSNLPVDIQRDVLCKMKETDSPKFENWVTGLLRIPFGKHTLPPASTISNRLSKAASDMDAAIFGHTRAKQETLSILCQQLRSRSSSCFAIGLHGPPGIGKTTFAQSALKCLNRPFFFISLSGASDASNLVGHSYTYEGAIPGRIVECLQSCQTMDPILYFDELDKIADTPKGKEIVGILTALTDPEQSKLFRDRYFHHIDIDLSRACLVFSFNKKEAINDILIDRIKCIEMDAPSVQDKADITSGFLLPKELRRAGLEEGSVVFDDETVHYFVSRCVDSGVRSIQKDVSHVVSRINLEIVTKEEENMAFPYVCTLKKAEDILKDRPASEPPALSMYN